MEVTPDEVQPDARARIDALSKQATEVLDAYSNGSPVLSRDGETLAFRSNRHGTLSLYVASASDPASAPRRLVDSDERVNFLARPPGTDLLVYTSDRGADERQAIFVTSPQGGTPKNLTPEPDQLRDNPVFTRVGAPTAYFSTRAPAATDTRIARVPLDGSAPAQELAVEPHVGRLVGVTPDGSLGLFVRIETLSNHRLVALDLRKGAPSRVLSPTSGEAAIQAVAVVDAGRCLVATDDGAEQSLVHLLDLASGRRLATYTHTSPTAAIRSIVVSEDGRMAALLVDAGNRNEVLVLDVGSMKVVAKPELPLGDGGPSGFSADGRRFGLRWATPNSPGDLFYVDARSGKLSPARVDSRPTLASFPPIDTSIVSVPAHDGLVLPTNVYVPRERAGRLPVIVMVHGGPAASSSVGYSPFIRFYTSQGFAVVEPNVRGSTGFGRAYEQADDRDKRLDAVEDLASIAKWVRSQEWADGSRMAIWGGSYGGYMTLMGLTRQPELWRAGVDLVGPSSWRSFMATTTGMIRTVLSKEFGSVETDGEFLDSISPLRDVDRIRSALFVFQGANDPRVPRSESDVVVASLRRRDVPVEYMLAPDEGHSLDRRHNQVAFLARTTHFLQRHLAAP